MLKLKENVNLVEYGFCDGVECFVYGYPNREPYIKICVKSRKITIEESYRGDSGFDNDNLDGLFKLISDGLVELENE